MSYPPLPSNGETQWGDKFIDWADAIESGKVEGTGLTLRYDTSVGERLFLDHPGGTTMLWGDTGWRVFELESGATGFSPAPAIRRVGDLVTIQGRVSPPDGGLTSNILGTIPVGFRPRHRNTTIAIGMISTAFAGSAPKIITHRANTHALECPTDFASASTINAVFTTLDLWPTTLPDAVD